MIGNFPEILNFNRLFLKLNQFYISATNSQFPPFIVQDEVFGRGERDGSAQIERIDITEKRASLSPEANYR